MAEHIFYRNYNKFSNSQKKNQLKIMNQLKEIAKAKNRTILLKTETKK